MRRQVAIVLVVGMLLCMTGCQRLAAPVTTTTESTVTTTEAVTTTTTAKPTTKHKTTAKVITTKKRTTTTVKTTPAPTTTKTTVPTTTTTTTVPTTTTTAVPTATTTTTVTTTTTTVQQTTATQSNLFFVDSLFTAQQNPVLDTVYDLEFRELLIPPSGLTWMCMMPSSWDQELKQTNYLVMTKGGNPVGRILHKSATAFASGSSRLQEFVYQNRQTIMVVEYKAKGGMAEVYRAKIKIDGAPNEEVILEVDRNFITAEAFGEMALSFFASSQPLFPEIPDEPDYDDIVDSNNPILGLDPSKRKNVLLFTDERLELSQIDNTLHGMFAQSSWNVTTVGVSWEDGYTANDWANNESIAGLLAANNRTSDLVAIVWGEHSAAFDAVARENGAIPVTVLTEEAWSSDDPLLLPWYDVEAFLLEFDHPEWLYLDAARTKLSPYGGYALSFLILCGAYEEMPMPEAGASYALDYLTSIGVTESVAKEEINELWWLMTLYMLGASES